MGSPSVSKHRAPSSAPSAGSSGVVGVLAVARISPEVAARDYGLSASDIAAVQAAVAKGEAL